MCGRYLRRSDKQRIAEAFKAGELPEDFPRPPDYNIAPTTFQPVIRDSGESEREIVFSALGGCVSEPVFHPNRSPGNVKYSPGSVNAGMRRRDVFLATRCLPNQVLALPPIWGNPQVVPLD